MYIKDSPPDPRQNRGTHNSVSFIQIPREISSNSLSNDPIVLSDLAANTNVGITSLYMKENIISA